MFLSIKNVHQIFDDSLALIFSY